MACTVPSEDNAMANMSLLSVPLLIAMACPAHAGRSSAVKSRPERVTIYRDGYGSFEEELGATALRKKAVELPASTDLSSVALFRGNERVAAVVLREKTVKVRTAKGSRERKVGYLLSLRPERGAGVRSGTLLLRYAASGISWQPQIEVMTSQDGGQADLSVKAVITNGVLELEDCDTQLASGCGQLKSRPDYEIPYSMGPKPNPDGYANLRAADVLYKVGKQKLPKGSTVVVSVMAGRTQCNTKYIWGTGARFPVQKVLVLPSPFRSPLCPGLASVFRGNTMVSQDWSVWAAPQDELTLRAGSAPAIKVHRRVDTSQNPEARFREFNHRIVLRVTNGKEEEIQLAVVFRKLMGSRHKNEYHFKREPDRQPGNWMIWDLKLAPGASEKIEFDFDSERAQYSDYQSYEYRGPAF